MRGFIVFAGMVVSVYAPMPPPIIPGMVSLVNSFLSTFPSFRCDRPDMPLVNISAVWTLALAVAGGMPMLSRMVVELIP